MNEDSLFVDASDLVEIKIYYKKKNNKCQAITEEEFQKLNKLSESEKNDANFNKEDYIELNVNMKELTWGLYNDFQEAAMELTESGERIFNYRKYKENKFEKLLVSWDAKDRDGSVAKINSQMIKKLPPEIPEVVLKSYDTVSVLDKDSEKN